MQRLAFNNYFIDDDDDLILMLCENSNENGHKRQHGGSLPGKHPNLKRDISSGHNRIYADYFADEPVYTDAMFRRRFRMSRPLFLRVVNAVEERSSYFIQKRDALGVLGASSLQKCTAAIRMLAYGTAADACDEYCRLSETVHN